MTDRDPDEYAPRGRPSRYDIREDYDDEFGRDRTPLGLARQKVLGPAVAFGVIGILGIVGMGVAVFAFVVTQANLGRPTTVIGILICFLLMGLAAGLFVVVLVGGIHLRNLRRRGLALTAAYIVTSLAVAGPYGLPFFPFGVWALVVLYQPDVREQFRRPPDPARPEGDR